MTLVILTPPCVFLFFYFLVGPTSKNLKISFIYIYIYIYMYIGKIIIIIIYTYVKYIYKNFLIIT
jgi:hypothetical protein